MSAPTLDALVALEVEVWSALVRGDAATDARLLSSDFLGVDPTGYADRAGHVEQLADGPTVLTFAGQAGRTVLLPASLTNVP